MRSLIRAAASSIASGRPSSRRGDPRDGRRIRVGELEARPDRRRAGDEQPDRLELAEGREVDARARAGRFSRSISDRWLVSGGAGSPGRGTPAPRRRGARPVVTRNVSSGIGAASRRRPAPRRRPARSCRAPAGPGRRRRLLDHVDRGARRAVGDARAAGDRRRHERRVADRVEGDEPHAVGEVIEPPPRRPAARAASFPCHPARSASGGASASSSAPASASSRSRPTNVVSCVGRLFGRASSVRSGGNVVGQPVDHRAGSVARARAGP